MDSLEVFTKPLCRTPFKVSENTYDCLVFETGSFVHAYHTLAQSVTAATSEKQSYLHVITGLEQKVSALESKLLKCDSALRIKSHASTQTSRKNNRHKSVQVEVAKVTCHEKSVQAEATVKCRKKYVWVNGVRLNDNDKSVQAQPTVTCAAGQTDAVADQSPTTIERTLHMPSTRPPDQRTGEDVRLNHAGVPSKATSERRKPHLPMRKQPRCRFKCSEPHSTASCNNFPVQHICKRKFIRMLEIRNRPFYDHLAKFPGYTPADFHARTLKKAINNTRRSTAMCHQCNERGHWTSDCKQVEIQEVPMSEWFAALYKNNEFFYEKLKIKEKLRAFYLTCLNYKIVS